MANSTIRNEIQRILKPADVRINGDRPWDIQVHSPDFYPRVYAGGSIALGESYMDGWWDCESLDQFFTRILECRVDQNACVKGKCLCAALIKTTMMNLQNRSRAFIIGERHYNTGNDLFSLMLDKRMNYSCGYWKDAPDLEKAQEDKLELICRKINLKPGMEVLDIGCGWGAFVKYAAEIHGAVAHGITVSEEQAEYAKETCKDLDVRIDLMDYRALERKYDAIVSIGMFEHVGWKNYKTFMKTVRRSLKKGGLFLLHTIAGNKTRKTVDPWFEKYIFSQLHAAVSQTYILFGGKRVGFGRLAQLRGILR